MMRMLFSCRERTQRAHRGIIVLGMVGVLVWPVLAMGAGVSVTASEMDVARQWVAAKFEGNAVALAPEAWLEVVANHGPVQANARGGMPMRIVGEEHSRGLYCHAPSKVIVHLPGKGMRFEAVAGVDSNDQTTGGRGSVVFSVTAAGKTVWESPVMREGMPGAAVSVALEGAMDIALEVSDSGDGISCDQADWVEACVTLEDGAKVWLGELPVRGQTRLPFDVAPFVSFVYGGKPSAELLPGWKTERASRALDESRVEHTLIYTDPETGLAVRCVGVAYLDFPTVEWTVYFTNTGKANTPILSDIQAIDTRFDREETGEFALHRNTGDICTPESYEPHVEPLTPDTERRIANTGGRPTQSEFPYFNIEGPGEGLIFVVSWAGQWNASFTRDAGNGLRVKGGQEGTHFMLFPGEEVRGPMIVLQFYQGDWWRAQNVWRRWMFAHNLPRPGGKPLAPMSSLCTGNFYPGLMTEAVQERAFLQRHLDEKVPFTCWWQDAGWYPCDGVGWPKTGTWEVDPVRFPKGLRELSDLMHANGKKTMVWFEPERVHPGTWIAETHPEWVHGGKDGGLLRLGVPECRAWLTDHIDALLTAQGIDYYRQDFNMDPLPFWQRNDTEDRRGITEIRHVEGYFAYWDELLRRHPGMLMDSCASGGRRNDLETLRRAVPLLRSDWYANPGGQQCLTYGLSMWVPYHGTGVIYNQGLYWFRSSMVTEMSYGPSTDGLAHTDFDLVRKVTSEQLEIAPYFYGDFYPLLPYTHDEGQWMAWQFDRPELGGGVVQAFRREKSSYESVRLPLRGLDEAAVYAVRNLDGGEVVEVSGKALMTEGWRVAIGERGMATVFVYARK